MVFLRRGLACPQMSFAVYFFLLAFVAKGPLERCPFSSPIPACSHSAVQARGLCRELLRRAQIATTLGLSYTFAHVVHRSSEGEVPLSASASPGSLLGVQILRPPS